MSAESVVGAVVGAWSGITTTGFPSVLWFDGVPVKDSTGAAVSLPTVELIDGGTQPEYDLEYNPIERTTLMFVVRATTLAEADSIVKRLKYGGGAVGAGLGYDFANSLSFASGIRLFEGGVVRTSEKRSREAARDVSANPVHKIEVGYTVTIIRTGV